MNYWLGVFGAWLLSDSIFSYTLYAHSQSWRGDRQTWLRDHWIRAVRAGIAIALIVMGWSER